MVSNHFKLYHNLLLKRLHLSFTNICSSVLKPLMVVELNNIMKIFNSNKASGHDNTSLKIIQLSFQNTVHPLATIINLFLSSGVFPKSLKIAKLKVITVFKADDPQLLTNYRPILILAAFSKLFERVMYNCMVKCLDLHSIS